MEALGKTHPLLRKNLLDSWPQALTETTCVLGFDPEFSGEIKEVRKTSYDHVHRMIVKRLGRSVKIEFVEADQPVRWSHQNKQEASPDTVPSTNLRSWEKNPAVRQVLEVFHGDVRDVQR